MAESFFLDPDEAKSMGDIDYMRTARKVRKTFPSTKAWGNAFEQEVEVSATEMVNGNGRLNGQNMVPSELFQASEEVKDTGTVRRRAATDLDMFRKMAKDIRKA
jgi:hypothetical protein